MAATPAHSVVLPDEATSTEAQTAAEPQNSPPIQATGQQTVAVETEPSELRETPERISQQSRQLSDGTTFSTGKVEQAELSGSKRAMPRYFDVPESVGSGHQGKRVRIEINPIPASDFDRTTARYSRGTWKNPRQSNSTLLQPPPYFDASTLVSAVNPDTKLLIELKPIPANQFTREKFAHCHSRQAQPKVLATSRFNVVGWEQLLEGVPSSTSAVSNLADEVSDPFNRDPDDDISVAAKTTAQIMPLAEHETTIGKGKPASPGDRLGQSLVQRPASPDPFVLAPSTSPSTTNCFDLSLFSENELSLFDSGFDWADLSERNPVFPDQL